MRKSGTMIVFASLLGVAAIATAAEPTDVSGTWTMTMTTPRGERTSTLVFVQDGEKLTVTSKSERGESTGAGTITGNAIEWSITRETPMGTMSSTYRGTVEGASMSGTVDMRGNDVPWKAVRAE
jgi:hypothetical protein